MGFLTKEAGILGLKIIGIAVSLWIFFSILAGPPNHSGSYFCELKYQMTQMNFKGRIIKIFRDPSNHSAETVIIHTGSSDVRLLMTNEENRIFYRLQVSDSVIKQKGNLNLIVYRSGKKVLLPMAYDCN